MYERGTEGEVSRQFKRLSWQATFCCLTPSPDTITGVVVRRAFDLFLYARETIGEIP